MAACHSSPLCAPLGLLLPLMIGVISSHLPEVEARPTDFWCNHQARKNMEKRIDGLKTDMVACVGADTLPSSVQLPCVSVQTTEWANKSLQQKHAEVVGALRVFQGAVQGTRKQTTSGCQTSLLEKLEHHITNYLVLVNRLHIQNDTVTSSHCAVQNSSSLNIMLNQYRNLLKGKLERLAVDLRDSICNVDRTIESAT